MPATHVATPDRLRSERDIARVLRRRRRGGSSVSLHVDDRGDGGPARVAVVASRRVGSAVARNRAKRLLREAARRVPWVAGTDAVLVARAGCGGRGLADVEREVRRLADELGISRTEAADRG